MIVVSPVEISFPLGLALRRITVRLTREGVETANPKDVFLLSPSTLTLRASFIVRDGVNASQLFLASAVDRDHLLLATDTALPRRSAARYPAISEDVVFAVDLNDGTWTGGGAPTTVAAQVRVEGSPAAREVVALERQTDGVWRVAGHQRLSDGTLDLLVTGGAVYAVAVDDYGTLYQPNLAVAVGDVIRPTLFKGWLYRITQAGSLPATEPVWWDGNTAGPQDLGSARAEMVRYHRPLAHGPIAVEMT